MLGASAVFHETHGPGLFIDQTRVRGRKCRVHFATGTHYVDLSELFVPETEQEYSKLTEELVNQIGANAGSSLATDARVSEAITKLFKTRAAINTQKL